MGKIAFLFSGQGAQKPGMGSSFYGENPRVRALFDRAEALRPGTLDMMFSGDETELRKTINTQPCLYLADLAAAMAMADLGVQPDGVAGFSLGELAALAFAGAYTGEAGFSLVCSRGKRMDAAASEVEASMAVIVKLDNATIEGLCARFNEVYPVNYNAPGQLAISGVPGEMKKLSQAAREAGGRMIPLNVSGGFHSPFMDSAAQGFAGELEKMTFQKLNLPVYANYTGRPYGDDIPALLKEQMNHPVKWEDTIRAMAADGYDTFVETGCGNVLQKLVEKILPEAKVFAVSNMDQAKETAEELKAHA